MEAIHRDAAVRCYRALLEQHGPVPQALGWGACPRQTVRFSVLWDELRHDLDASVLDVGCGFADLCTYLRGKGWRGRYHGIDLVPEMVRIARGRHPDEDIRVLDLTSAPPQEPVDFVYEAGIFNYRLPGGNEKAHAAAMLQAMFRTATRAVVCDWLSAYVDFQRPESCHWEPDFVLRTARTLTKRLRLRMDYLPYEFAVILWKDDRVGPNRVFAALDPP
jgi:SAM-dependent methyltransferase